MNGRCMYFEKTRLTFDEAAQNCQQTMKELRRGGILYQPYSIAEQKKVVDMAYEHGLSYFTWIGVTDIGTIYVLDKHLYGGSWSQKMPVVA